MDHCGAPTTWWSRVWQRVRPARAAPRVSDLLPLPTWSEHPLGRMSNLSPAWYLLLVPTLGEGEDVLELLPTLLDGKREEFTVLVGYGPNDPTRESIMAAAKLNPRIVPIAASHSGLDAIEAALIAGLKRLEEEAGRRATDTLIVPFPALIAKRLP